MTLDEARERAVQRFDDKLLHGFATEVTRKDLIRQTLRDCEPRLVFVDENENDYRANTYNDDIYYVIEWVIDNDEYDVSFHYRHENGLGLYATGIAHASDLAQAIAACEEHNLIAWLAERGRS